MGRAKLFRLGQPPVGEVERHHLARPKEGRQMHEPLPHESGTNHRHRIARLDVAGLEAGQHAGPWFNRHRRLVRNAVGQFMRIHCQMLGRYAVVFTHPARIELH